MHRDTLPAAEQVQLEALRRLAPVERLRMALEMSDALQRVARAARERSVRDAPPGGNSWTEAAPGR